MMTCVKIWIQTCERDIANIVEQKLAVRNWGWYDGEDDGDDEGDGEIFDWVQIVMMMILMMVVLLVILMVTMMVPLDDN